MSYQDVRARLLQGRYGECLKLVVRQRRSAMLWVVSYEVAKELEQDKQAGTDPAMTASDRQDAIYASELKWILLSCDLDDHYRARMEEIKRS